MKNGLKTTPFTIASNNGKCIGLPLTKQVNNLYDRNFKSLKKISEYGKIFNLTIKIVNMVILAK